MLLFAPFAPSLLRRGEVHTDFISLINCIFPFSFREEGDPQHTVQKELFLLIRQRRQRRRKNDNNNDNNEEETGGRIVPVVLLIRGVAWRGVVWCGVVWCGVV